MLFPTTMFHKIAYNPIIRQLHNQLDDRIVTPRYDLLDKFIFNTIQSGALSTTMNDFISLYESLNSRLHALFFIILTYIFNQTKLDFHSPFTSDLPCPNMMKINPMFVDTPTNVPIRLRCPLHQLFQHFLQCNLDLEALLPQTDGKDGDHNDKMAACRLEMIGESVSLLYANICQRYRDETCCDDDQVPVGSDDSGHSATDKEQHVERCENVIINLFKAQDSPLHKVRIFRLDSVMIPILVTLV